MDFRILPLLLPPSNEDRDETESPVALRTDRECRQRYRARGQTPRKVSAENAGIAIARPRALAYGVGQRPDLSLPLAAESPELTVLELGHESTAVHVPASPGTQVPQHTAPPPAPYHTSNGECERRDRRLFRENGTPRRVPNAGFRIQPMTKAAGDEGGVGELEK